MVNTIDLSSEEGRYTKYNCIDLMKFLLAILVVANHVTLFSTISPRADYVIYISSGMLCVPFYFISNGYLLFRKMDYETFDRSVTLNYAFRILKLYIIWEAIYLPPIVYYYILTRINRKSYFAFPPNFKYNKEKYWRTYSCYLRINMLTKLMVSSLIMTV